MTAARPSEVAPAVASSHSGDAAVPDQTILVLPEMRIAARGPGWHLPREGRLWIVVILGLWLTGWWKGINLILLLCYLMICVLGTNLLLARRQVGHLRAERLEDGPIFAGSSLPRGVVVANERLGSAMGFAVGEIAATDQGARTHLGWFVLQYSGEFPLRLVQAQRFPERGLYRSGPVLAWSRYPFGLVQYSQQIAEATEVLVYPRLGHLDRRRMADWLGGATAGDGRHHALIRRPFASQEAEVHGLRPFRPGDSPRWIHWRTSARRDQLMVREYMDPPSPDLLLAVDAWLPNTGDADCAEALEASIALAATIVWTWCQESGMAFGLLVAGAKPAAISGRSHRELGLRMLDLLAREPGCPSADLTASEQLIRPDWSQRSILVLSPRSHPPLAALLQNRLGIRVAVVNPSQTLDWYSA